MRVEKYNGIEAINNSIAIFQLFHTYLYVFLSLTFFRAICVPTCFYTNNLNDLFFMQSNCTS